ncbi:unnamed protein product, partial [Meganyctiphanes norvegica]
MSESSHIFTVFSKSLQIGNIIEYVPWPPEPTSNQSESSLDCGGEYNSSSGIIRHPLGGGNYQNNENCTWIISAAKYITITFVSFDTQTRRDYLYVRDGQSMSSAVIGIFSGTRVPSSVPGPVKTTTTSAHLHFTTDYTETRTGF